MRVAREKLIFYALSVLVRWSEKAASGPVEPDVSVRLALALLHACGHSGDRRCYDEFWSQLRDPGLPNKEASQNNDIRRSYCDSSIKGIMRDIGAPQTPDYWNAIRRAIRTEKKRGLEIAVTKDADGRQ